MLKKQIKTELNSFQLYTIFKDRKESFFLDSGMDSDKLGQFSFIGFEPVEVIKSKGNEIEHIIDGKKSTSIGDPFEELRKVLKKYEKDYSDELPFVGGAVGYLGYDLCHHIEKITRTAIDDVDIPDMHFGIYDKIIVIDHRENKDYVYVITHDLIDDEKKMSKRIISEIELAEKNGVNIEFESREDEVEFKSNFNSRSHYEKTVDEVRNYIKKGDIYQANLTQRFETDYDGDAYELYGKLRNINPAPFASYLNYDDVKIVSSSPERFIKIKDGTISTRPIKGTIARGKTKEEDEENRETLINSEKDKSELLIIVDLERNDLSKIAKTGTVKVIELFHLEEYPTVYHLVATIDAEIKDECDIVDCIKATFPGGSITGSPKIRSMEVIDELEPTQRNIYTGSIGYIGFNGDADLNIVIRTIVCKEDKAYFQVGGGITWDSNAEKEYDETLDKARALVRSFNL